MSASLKGTKLLWVAVLLGCLANATAQAAAPAAERPTAVKALLIGLTDDKNIGTGVAADLQSMEAYVRGLPGFDTERDLTKLSGPEVTPANIRRAVQNLDVSPTDVFFCFYAGHGAYDPRLAKGDPSGGHFFQIPGGDLRHADLMKWLKNKGARLTVLISETCNVAEKFQPPAARASALKSAGKLRLKREPTPEPIVSPTLAMLLFNYTGVVDVSGASRDQYGVVIEAGSLSTFGLLLALKDKDESARVGKNPFRSPGELPLDWERFLQDAAKDIHTLFQKAKAAILAEPEPDDVERQEVRRALRGQKDLQPQTFELDVRPVERMEERTGDVRPTLAPPPARPKTISYGETFPRN